MKDKFPGNWYLRIDDDNRKIVNQWRENSQYGGFGESEMYKYVTNECWIWQDKKQNPAIFEKKIQITTEQFRVHILNLEPEPLILKSEDCKYLIKLFKKLKIK